MIEVLRKLARIGRPSRILIIAATAAVISSGSTASFAQSDGSWRVSDLKGNARLYQDGAGWHELRRGDIVRAGGRVETGTDSRIILVRPGDSIDVAPNSRFEIASDPAVTNNPASRIIQSMGTLLFKITTRPDRPFKVNTKYLAAVIKGTTFTVSATRTDSALHVSKGAVEVRSILSKQMVMVRPGQTAAINGARGGQMHLIGYPKSRSNRGKRTNRAASQALKFSEATTGTAEAGRGALISAESSNGAAKAGGNVKAGGGAFKIEKAVGAGRINIGKLSKGLVSSAAPNKAAGGRGKDKGGVAASGDTGDTDESSPRADAQQLALIPAASESVAKSENPGRALGPGVANAGPVVGSIKAAGASGIASVNPGLAGVAKDIGKPSKPPKFKRPKVDKSIGLQ